MTLRFLLKQLLLPPAGLLLALLLGLWLLRRRPRLGRGLIICAFGLLWLLCLPVVAQHLAAWVERDVPLAASQWPGISERAQAIVVLGGGRSGDDPGWGGPQPTPLTQERLRYAARIARASGLPLLVSGGWHFGQPPSEARLMADSLRLDYGLEPRWLEENSRTTWENARDSAPLLQAAGVRQIVLVTQAMHMPRARWCFERWGFTVIPAPVTFISAALQRPDAGWLPDAQALAQNLALLNELLGWPLYVLSYDAPQAYCG